MSLKFSKYDITGMKTMSECDTASIHTALQSIKMLNLLLLFPSKAVHSYGWVHNSL